MTAMFVLPTVSELLYNFLYESFENIYSKCLYKLSLHFLHIKTCTVPLYAYVHCSKISVIIFSSEQVSVI